MSKDPYVEKVIGTDWPPRRTKFDCPECGTTYTDYKNFASLRVGGKKCNECGFHIHLGNAENMQKRESL